jgi:hypothetical protein
LNTAARGFISSESVSVYESNTIVSSETTTANQSAILTPEASFATAQQLLLSPYSLDDVRLQTVFGEIMTHRVDYADLYFQYSRSES